MDDHFWMLRMYSGFTKIMSLLTLLTGLVLEGITIYGWGRLTAFYDIIRTAWKTFADSYNQFNTTGITLPATLTPIPIWPLLAAMFLILLFMITFAFTLWAIGEWIDMKITLAKEERESRAILVKSMNTMTHDLSAVSGYFSSLAAPHK
jgi:hypothetical protein